MTKKIIQYRKDKTSGWQTIAPADIKAAPENHNHTVNDINGVLPVNKGGTGQQTVEAAPFVKKGNRINTAFIDANWNNNQPMSIWTNSSNQTVTSNYGLCINTTNPFLFNANTSPQTIWTGLTTKNVDKWVKTNINTIIGKYLSAKVRAFYTNDYLQLFYINIWDETTSGSNLQLAYGIDYGSWIAPSIKPNRDAPLYFKAQTNSPLYKNSNFFDGYSTAPFSDIRFGYYLGTAQIKTTDGITDASVYLVCDGNNSGIHIITAISFTNAKSIKFSGIFPYSLIGLSTTK